MGTVLLVCIVCCDSAFSSRHPCNRSPMLSVRPHRLFPVRPRPLCQPPLSIQSCGPCAINTLALLFILIALLWPLPNTRFDLSDTFAPPSITQPTNSVRALFGP